MHVGAVATVVNEAGSQDPPYPPEFARLNGAELRVLRLLAEGHTAKSIANLIGATPAAVNERLREARRKTGVGSSRELARRLKALENRDNEIGIAAAATPAASVFRPVASLPRRRVGVFVMVGLGLVAVAGAVALTSQAPSVLNEVDPIIGSPLFSGDPAAWHAKVRSERRDPQWASKAEATLRDRFSHVPHVGGPGSILRVMCATSICEVAGTIDAPQIKTENYDPDAPLARSMRELQGKALHDDLLRAGLESNGAAFTGTKSKPERMAFFIYFLRRR